MLNSCLKQSSRKTEIFCIVKTAYRVKYITFEMEHEAAVK